MTIRRGVRKSDREKYEQKEREREEEDVNYTLTQIWNFSFSVFFETLERFSLASHSLWDILYILILKSKHSVDTNSQYYFLFR